MKNLIALSSFALVLALSVTACKKSGDAGEGGTTAKREYITLGTAPTGGAFAPVGAAIVNAVTTGLPALSNRNWVVSTEGTKGTMQNIRQLDAGSLQFGMANSAITYFAERGTEGWDKKYGVQHVMTLAPNVAQFVALEKSNIKSIADFKGKRVVVGPAGAGFNYFIDPILKAHGITTADFDPRNNTYSGAVDMLKNGDADVAFLGGAVPIQAVVSAASTHKIAFVPYDPAAVKTLAEEYEFYAPVTIAADKYSFLKEDFQAISCGQMQLICASALGEDIVYDFTKTLYEQRAEVVKGHPAGRAINPKNAARSVGSTFHPGAIKFYKEIGIGGFLANRLGDPTMDISSHIKEKLRDLPSKPGVYLMRDRNRKVIYVGKAKSLRSRVRSYFQAGSKRSADPKIRGLIRSIADFDYIVVRTEAEATLSEGRLIKEYRPRYNTSFKDDKRFLLLRLNPKAPYPRLETARIQKKDGYDYFGPYASAASARAAKDFAEKHFGIRHCRTRIPGEQDYKHCMADIIRHCSAPCIGTTDSDAYRARIDEASAFLRGERPDVLTHLEADMKAAAELTNFEKAAALRDTLLLLRKAIKQRATGTKDLHMKREDAKHGIEELAEALRSVRVLRKDAPAPANIECFDISNISGTYAVASMVSCMDGLPRPQRYRRFRIKTIEGANDPAMMAEAVGRRYRRLRDEEQSFPDLIIVDGGITQLRAAHDQLTADGITIPMVGLAKQFEELVWDLSNIRPPIYLPRDSQALHVVTRIRDEAHRFALTYHRSLRARRIRDSQLDEIQGIGERRKQLLLSHFGSVDRLRNATREQILEIDGIGPTFADLILESLAK